jgi:hypothetical protein
MSRDVMVTFLGCLDKPSMRRHCSFSMTTRNSFGHLSKVNDLGLPLVAEMLGFDHFEA